MKLFSFPPIANENSKVLILGTMPGVDSLRFNEYYAHQRNAFWKILFTLFNQPITNDYETKKQLLLNNNIALWDVLKTCSREGSLDANIQAEEPNELTQFVSGQNNSNHIFFNGNKACDYFFKYNKQISIPYKILPSTSPAHTMSFDKKSKGWSVVKQFV